MRVLYSYMEHPAVYLNLQSTPVLEMSYHGSRDPISWMDVGFTLVLVLEGLSRVHVP